MVKSWPGPGQKYNLLYSTASTHPVSCVAKETMDLWAFLWPIHSGYEI